MQIPSIDAKWICDSNGVLYALIQEEMNGLEANYCQGGFRVECEKKQGVPIFMQTAVVLPRSEADRGGTAASTNFELSKFGGSKFEGFREVRSEDGK
jgi:hypothetical protein